MNHFIAACLFTISLVFVKEIQAQQPFSNAEALNQFLSVQPNRVKPLLLAHRGGPLATETENSLETFRHTYAQIPDAIIEMDVRMTADSVLVLLHDDDIERTTTGKGFLGKMRWKELQALYLRDLRGNPTRQRIPAFAEVLRWGAGKVVMAIDAKPGVDLRKVMQEISTAGAIHSVFIICYSVADAKMLRKQYPNLWIALGFNEPTHTKTLQEAGLAVRHVIALASRQKQDFYRHLHQDGIPCTAGTYGRDNLDEKPIKEVAQEYKNLFNEGADILTTDRPVEVNALFGQSPEKVKRR